MMKFVVLVVVLLVVTVNGFKLHSSRKPNNQFALKASKFDPTSQTGSSAPLGFFDPLGFSYDVSEAQFKLFQEAEIKHGRVSMLAFLGLVAGELFPHPFFDGAISGPAIYQFQQTYTSAFPQFWIFLVAAIGAIEAKSIVTNWQPIGETSQEPGGLAKLRASAVPGDLGFDPLGFKPSSLSALATIKTKELNNGRLAMIGVLGIVVQELATGQSIF